MLPQAQHLEWEEDHQHMLVELLLVTQEQIQQQLQAILQAAQVTMLQEVDQLLEVHLTHHTVQLHTECKQEEELQDTNQVAQVQATDLP